MLLTWIYLLVCNVDNAATNDLYQKSTRKYNFLAYVIIRTKTVVVPGVQRRLDEV